MSKSLGTLGDREISEKNENSDILGKGLVQRKHRHFSELNISALPTFSV
jgi:hypothetical protein